MKVFSLLTFAIDSNSIDELANVYIEMPIVIKSTDICFVAECFLCNTIFSVTIEAAKEPFEKKKLISYKSKMHKREKLLKY